MHQIPMVQQAHQQQQRLQLEKQKQAFKELQQGQGQYSLPHAPQQHQTTVSSQPSVFQPNALLAVANAASTAEAGVATVASAALNQEASVGNELAAHSRAAPHTASNVGRPIIPTRFPRPESHGMLTSLRLPPPGSFGNAPPG